MSYLRLPRFVSLSLCLAIGAVGCKSQREGAGKGAGSDAPSAGTVIEYGPPVGARVTGNAHVASFEIALAAQGAEPDDCLPMVIQAVSNVSANCPGVPAELTKKGHVSITFETLGGQLEPQLVSSEYFDDTGLDCVRGELKKAIGKLPQQQKVRYLLQVRPLAS